MFCWKNVLKICSRFTGEHPYQSAFSIKLLCNFIEIALRCGCSPVNLQHIFRTSFQQNTSDWLLLTKIYVSDSLCPHYLGLWNKYKKLWNNKKIFSYFTVSGTVRIKLDWKWSIWKHHTCQIFEGSISRGADFHVLSSLGIYKQLRLFLNCVHLFFIVFVLCVWQYSCHAPFFALFLMTLVIWSIALFICLVLLFCCVVVFPWCSDNHVC